MVLQYSIVFFTHLYLYTDLFSSSTYASFLSSLHMLSRSYSYVPAESRKIGKPYTQKFDYSQVQSRVDTGRSISPASSESSLNFGLHSSRARSRVFNAHRSSSPSPGLVTNRKFSSRVNAANSKSERISTSRIADYGHIKSRIDAGSRTSSASSTSSERLTLSADSGLKAKIGSAVLAAGGGQAKVLVSSSPLPDYSHIKSRTDSGQRPRSRSPRSTSMSHNKVVN